MSILSRAAAPLLERRGANGAQPWGATDPPSNGMLSSPVAGTNVTEKTALQVAAVYGSIGVLTDAVSTLPINMINSPDAAHRKLLPPSQLITEPYSEISLMDWLVQFVESLALRGNFYGQIVQRDKNLYATQIKPIHPDDVRVRRLYDGSIEYLFYGKPVPGGIENVFHVRYISTPGSLTGLNSIEYLRNTYGLARAADLYGGSFYQNSAIPSGVLEVEGQLDEEETLAMIRSWNQMHQGIGQANLPAILTEGTTYKPISLKPDDMQFIQSRGFSQAEISGMIFRVPPHMIGIVDRSTSWGTGIEQQEMGFVRNTLAGYLKRYENAITKLSPPGNFVRFDLSHRLRGDKGARYAAYSLGRLGGWLSANDIRADEDMPPITGPGGDEYLVPINSELLEVALQELTSPAPAPAPAFPETGGSANG